MAHCSRSWVREIDMEKQVDKPTVPPWLYKLFTGHQYPYVRRQAKFANRDTKPGEERPEPTREEIDAKFWEIYPRCTAKILQEVKSGMIVVFHELGDYPPGGSRSWWIRRRSFWQGRTGRRRSK